MCNTRPDRYLDGAWINQRLGAFAMFLTLLGSLSSTRLSTRLPRCFWAVSSRRRRTSPPTAAPAARRPGLDGRGQHRTVLRFRFRRGRGLGRAAVPARRGRTVRPRRLVAGFLRTAAEQSLEEARLAVVLARHAAWLISRLPFTRSALTDANNVGHRPQILWKKYHKKHRFFISSIFLVFVRPVSLCAVQLRSGLYVNYCRSIANITSALFVFLCDFVLVFRIKKNCCGHFGAFKIQSYARSLR